MVLEDDPGVDLQAFVRPAVFERVHDDLASTRGSKDGQPADDRGGDEVGYLQLLNAIPAAHVISVGEAKLRGQERSQVQLGNERK